jgi:hypothetical protein
VVRHEHASKETISKIGKYADDPAEPASRKKYLVRTCSVLEVDERTGGTTRSESRVTRESTRIYCYIGPFCDLDTSHDMHDKLRLVLMCP